MNYSEFLKKCWDQYTQITPSSKKVLALLGKDVANDHIAFRTFKNDKIGLQFFDSLLTGMGLEKKGEYSFPQKKVKAFHYESNVSGEPKVFVSELDFEDTSFSSEFISICQRLLAELPAEVTFESIFFQDLWNLSKEEYLALASESEYASWLSAHGLQANHFTVLINSLDSFSTIFELNEFLKTEGFSLNESGGEVKGSPTEYLEQSSTIADKNEKLFSNGPLEVPTCYYEFALRYPQESGKLFEGFVTTSADKIFESTYERK